MSEHSFHGRIIYLDPGGWDEPDHKADHLKTNGQSQGQCHEHVLGSHMFIQFYAVQYKSQRWVFKFN